MKILIIDPNVSDSSPSMKGVVRSLAHLRATGMEIEAWCWHCDDGLAIDKVDKLPRLGNLPLLSGFAFAWLVRMRAWWRFRIRKVERPDAVFTVAWYEPRCDIALVQFSPFDWERRQKLLGIKSVRDVVERVVNLLSLVSAHRFLKKTTARTMLCVSEAVRDDLRAVNPGLNYQLLPNSFDPARFNIASRIEHRGAMRAQHGFCADDVVFAFASAGHYRRKGFFLATEAISILRSRLPSARLLVIGGKEKRLSGLQHKLDGLYPDWRDWITFTGMVHDVEKQFAGSDALLFPSYSEAFALVEVEASACGLPLFLTRHHGSEMILRDGVNGRFLEFDAHHIAEVLTEFITGVWKPADTQRMPILDTGAYAEKLAAFLKGCSAQVPRKTVLSPAMATPRP